MKVAGICGIGVKLLQWLDSSALPPSASFPWFLALLYSAIAACSDAGDKLSRLRVKAPGGRSQPRKRL